ncbi:MAG: S-adenosylmethionine decarboxylase [Thaumarchaeota archaeon]|nr:S-adenosylmethionine decarboxylase [Nitrososphaerota archaeon]
MTWYHLMLDLYGCSKDSLDDERLLRDVFDELSRLMDLRIIAGPVIVRYVGEEGSPSGEGLSGFMIVAESHVSIHTDIRTGYASVDVYSCKEFDRERVERYLVGVFKPERVERSFLLRGPLRKPALLE